MLVDISEWCSVLPLETDFKFQFDQIHRIGINVEEYHGAQHHLYFVVS